MTILRIPPSERSPLLCRFEDGDIDPASFDHRAHLEVAFAYLEELPVIQALERVAAGLRALTERVGQPDRYHETLTAALVLIMAERRQRVPASSFDDFCRHNPDLLSDARGLLLQHYGEEQLASPLARRQFVLPAPAPSARRPGTARHRSR